MRNFLLGLVAAACVMTAVMAQRGTDNPRPTCTMCPGTYIPVAELQAYTKKAVAENLIDQQVRDIEIGKAHVGIGMVYRKKLDRPAKDSVAEHDLVNRNVELPARAHHARCGRLQIGQRSERRGGLPFGP